MSEMCCLQRSTFKGVASFLDAFCLIFIDTAAVVDAFHPVPVETAAVVASG